MQVGIGGALSPSRAEGSRGEVDPRLPRHPHRRDPAGVHRQARAPTRRPSPIPPDLQEPGTSKAPSRHREARRGEYCAVSSAAAGAIGSSARTWGTRFPGADAVRCARFIPTHVGNTWRASPSGSGRAVHPHARGEHSRSSLMTSSFVGSSPRTWGTHLLHDEVEGLLRFIPTHVGNTRRGPGCGCHPSVHPHARGEHVASCSDSSRSSGSSPRTWGTRDAAGVEDASDRFIPTHVGNTRRVT